MNKELKVKTLLIMTALILSNFAQAESEVTKGNPGCIHTCEVKGNSTSFKHKMGGSDATYSSKTHFCTPDGVGFLKQGNSVFIEPDSIFSYVQEYNLYSKYSVNMHENSASLHFQEPGDNFVSVEIEKGDSVDFILHNGMEINVTCY